LTDIHSVYFEGYPAASFTFEYYDGQDTCIRSLCAITPKANDLYYAAIKSKKDDNIAYLIGQKMLNTLHLKVDMKR